MKITYEIIEHDGGWAYKVGGTYSEGIEYEDTSGKWHHEVAEGTDRPEADVAEK